MERRTRVALRRFGRELCRAVLDGLVEPTCAGCGAPARGLCGSCRAGLVRFEQVALARVLAPELRREFALTQTGRRVDLVRAFDDLERTRQRGFHTEFPSARAGEGDSGGGHECDVCLSPVLAE